MPVNPLESYAILVIDEVDVTNRLAHCQDKTGSNIIASFRSTGAGIFRVPAQSEKWVAKLIGRVWYLDHLLDTTDNHLMVTSQMRSGDHRIASGDGGRVFVEAPVISGPSTAKRILGF